MAHQDHRPPSVQRLVDLGFSGYEAQAYVGLLGRPAMTGYALSNLTGIPQPKVYETLRRLARKGVAIQVAGDPALFVALPPDRLLAQLEGEFRQRLAEADAELNRPAAGDEQLRVLRALGDWPAIEACAAAMIDAAERHVYVSLHCDAPAVVAAIGRADAGGVAADVLHFGASELAVRHGRVIGHLSTEGVVYRHHQARHLAVVADGTRVLWALAADGASWEAVHADDGLLAAAVKGYIRHDMYVQQIAADFGPLLAERYGPGLAALVPMPAASQPPGAPEAPPGTRTA
ncbi:MAG: TrmB family transcriptional regulator [Streptosporangiaceae bacterium]